MKHAFKFLPGLLILLGIGLLTSGCQILYVAQPPTVAAGDTVTVYLLMQDPNLPSTGGETDRFVLCCYVPTDWSVDTAFYIAAEDNGTPIAVHGTGKVSTAWADSATLYFPPAAGMKWIGLLADSAHAYDDTLYIEAVVTFKSGTTTGDYPLGYLMTKNAGGLMDPSGFSQGWADTAMNNMITVTPPTSVWETDLKTVPSEFSLGQNYPNPFNPSTSIQYSIKEQSSVKLSVFDISGKEIAVLVDGVKAPGTYEVRFMTYGLASGVYLYKLQAGTFTATHKMVFMK